MTNQEQEKWEKFDVEDFYDQQENTTTITMPVLNPEKLKSFIRKVREEAKEEERERLLDGVESLPRHWYKDETGEYASVTISDIKSLLEK